MLTGALAAIASFAAEPAKMKMTTDIPAGIISPDLKKEGVMSHDKVHDNSSTPEDFNRLISSIQEKRDTRVAKILGRIQDLNGNITREEWMKAFQNRN